MLSQLLLADHRKMSDTDQEYVVLAEFAKCLDHILDSVNKSFPLFSFEMRDFLLETTEKMC